jgi:hypothetical protein
VNEPDAKVLRRHHPQHFSEKECSFHIDYGLELLFHIGGVTLPLARVPQLGCKSNSSESVSGFASGIA